MTRHEELIFPEDLKNAKLLQGHALSFSTVMRGDRGPYTGGGTSNTGGCVGVVIAPPCVECLIAVTPSDAGSFLDAEGIVQAFGEEPTADTCRRSIAERTEVNEWVIKDFKPLGVFVLPPLMVRSKDLIGGVETIFENEISLQEVLSAFPGDRVFSARPETYLEYDRSKDKWRAVSYQQIIDE